MAALEVDMVLNLVDRASGPAKAIMARMGLEKGGSGAVGHAANRALLALNRQMATFVAGAGAYPKSHCKPPRKIPA